MFHYFTIKFHFSFFVYFRIKFFASLRFTNFCFERNKAKRNSSLFFRFFHFFLLFLLFSLNFRFTLIFSLILPSVSLQIFGVSHQSESCEIRLFFATKRNKIFASISNFASEAKVRAHPTWK